MGMKNSTFLAALLALSFRPAASSDLVSQEEDTGDDFPEEDPGPDLEGIRRRQEKDAASQYFKCKYGNYPESISFRDVHTQFPDGVEVAEVLNGYALIRDPRNQVRFLMADVKAVAGSVPYKFIDKSRGRRIENKRSRIARKQRQKRLAEALSRYLYRDVPNKIQMTTYYYPNIHK